MKSFLHVLAIIAIFVLSEYRAEADNEELKPNLVSFKLPISDSMDLAFTRITADPHFSLADYFMMQGICFAKGASVSLDPPNNILNGKLDHDQAITLMELLILHLDFTTDQIIQEFEEELNPSAGGCWGTPKKAK